jgi:hypothetical protein
MPSLRRGVHLLQQTQTSSYDSQQRQWEWECFACRCNKQLVALRTYSENQINSWHAQQSTCSSSPVQSKETKAARRYHIRNCERRTTIFNVHFGPPEFIFRISVRCESTDAQTQRTPSKKFSPAYTNRSPAHFGQRGKHVVIRIFIASISITQVKRRQPTRKIKTKIQSCEVQGQRHDREEGQSRRRYSHN